jgi:hypothetical protein
VSNISTNGRNYRTANGLEVHVKIYGKTDFKSEHPEHLKEVTLVVTRNEVLDLARFFSECADEMNLNPDWEHKHLRDFLSKNSPKSDIVVFAKSKLP